MTGAPATRPNTCLRSHSTRYVSVTRGAERRVRALPPRDRPWQRAGRSPSPRAAAVAQLMVRYDPPSGVGVHLHGGDVDGRRRSGQPRGSSLTAAGSRPPIPRGGSPLASPSVSRRPPGASHSALTRDFSVETMGFEPTTPCLQSRCSNQLSYVPVFRDADQHLCHSAASADASTTVAEQITSSLWLPANRRPPPPAQATSKASSRPGCARCGPRTRAPRPSRPTATPPPSSSGSWSPTACPPMPPA